MFAKNVPRLVVLWTRKPHKQSTSNVLKRKYCKAPESGTGSRDFTKAGSDLGRGGSAREEGYFMSKQKEILSKIKSGLKMKDKPDKKK